MIDITPHNYEIPHTRDRLGNNLTHSKQWYAFWNNKCPVCDVEAEFKDEKTI